MDRGGGMTNAHTPRCSYQVNDDDFGELYVCRLPIGHDGTHRLIEQYRVKQECA